MSRAKETKSEKFVRLSEARKEKFLKQMQLFRNFSNTQVYEYSDEQVKELVTMMHREVDLVEDALMHREPRVSKLDQCR